jgi:hypothetical protein
MTTALVLRVYSTCVYQQDTCVRFLWPWSVSNKYSTVYVLLKGLVNIMKLQAVATLSKDEVRTRLVQAVKRLKSLDLRLRWLHAHVEQVADQFVGTSREPDDIVIMIGDHRLEFPNTPEMQAKKPELDEIASMYASTYRRWQRIKKQKEALDKAYKEHIQASWIKPT